MKTLKYWYITEAGKRYKGAVIAHGIVRGHERLSDGTKIYTSQIESVATNGSEGEVIINTRNSEYHCRLETALYCRFDEAGRDMLPNFERLREEYELQLIVPGTGNGALIVLDDEAEYQFVGAAFRIGEQQKEIRCPIVHLGMFQNSVLIEWLGRGGKIFADYRYFPFPGWAEFYMWDGGLDTYIRNAGSRELIVRIAGKEVRIAPGETQNIAAGDRLHNQ